MKKKYHCHDCDNEFILPEGEKPLCPECESTNVTFEGKIALSFTEKLFRGSKPFLNLLFFPWKFYDEREFNRAAFWLLILFSTAALLLAGLQVGSLTSPTPLQELNLTEHPGSIPSVFRGFQSFLLVIENTTESSRYMPDWLAVYISLVLWETIAFLILYSVFFFAGGRKLRDHLALVSAGTIWIPNLVIGGLIFILSRGYNYELWTLGFLNAELVLMIFWIFSAWVLYSFIGGLWSVNNAGGLNLIYIIPIAFVVQFIVAVVYVFLLNTYLYPLLGLVPAAGNILESSSRLVLWPWLLLFL